MHKIFIFVVAGAMILSGCRKEQRAADQNTVDATDTIGIYGKWRWKSAQAILLHGVTPPADSVVTLTLRPDGSYDVGLNGSVLMKGSFKIIQGAYQDTILHFNNFPQTVITNTQSGTSAIAFGTFDVGRLTLYSDELLSSFNDTLELVSEPISPEAYVSTFQKQIFPSFLNDGSRGNHY